MSVCRICKKWDEPLFKYAVRHYAHAECGLTKWGVEFLAMIPVHQVGNLPYRALEKTGHLDEARRIVEQEPKR